MQPRKVTRMCVVFLPRKWSDQRKLSAKYTPLKHNSSLSNTTWISSLVSLSALYGCTSWLYLQFNSNKIKFITFTKLIYLFPYTAYLSSMFHLLFASLPVICYFSKSYFATSSYSKGLSLDLVLQLTNGCEWADIQIITINCCLLNYLFRNLFALSTVTFYCMLPHILCLWSASSASTPHICIFRVTTSLENLEMSGNLKHVREMSGGLLTVREMSGKNTLACTHSMRIFYANTLNNNTIYLTLTPEVLATVYLNSKH